MHLYSEDELTGQLGKLSDAEPRAEFVVALEETLVREARKMKQKRSIRKWTAMGAGIAASMALAVGLMSSGGQDVLKNAFGVGGQQGKMLQMGGMVLPLPDMTGKEEVVYTEFDGKDYWLCIADAQTLKMKKKVLLTHGGSGRKVFKDPQGRFWCPMSVGLNGQTFYEIARYDPDTGVVTHAPLSGAVSDVFFTKVGTVIAGIGADNKPLTYTVSEDMKTQGGWSIGSPGVASPIYDGTFITYYLTEGAGMNQPGTVPGYFRIRPGSSNMESGAISEKQLATNIVFQGDKGQLYLYLNDGNGQFEEFDRQLKPLRKLSWEDVQHESRQLSVQERNQIQVGNNTYSILTMSNPKGTQIAVVDGRSGDVVRTITADFDANVSYANGMFYAVGKVEPKMAVLTQYGKLENEITTTGMDSNVVMK